MEEKHVEHSAATHSYAVESVRTVPEGPFLIVSDCRAPWQCAAACEVQTGLSERQQWSEPFAVFAVLNGRFVEYQVVEPD